MFCEVMGNLFDFIFVNRAILRCQMLLAGWARVDRFGAVRHSALQHVCAAELADCGFAFWSFLVIFCCSGCYRGGGLLVVVQIGRVAGLRGWMRILEQSGMLMRAEVVQSFGRRGF
jgi:hypothetical protein